MSVRNLSYAAVHPSNRLDVAIGRTAACLNTALTDARQAPPSFLEKSARTRGRRISSARRDSSSGKGGRLADPGMPSAPCFKIDAF
jgi:hypothetical protein